MKHKIFLGLLSVGICLGLWQVYRQRITISVIVPVYNAEKYLRRNLDSIMAQDGSFEVIAVNDGSTDNSRQILREYAEKFSNLKIINQSNQGAGAARNAGIKAAKMKYITFVDSDDWLEPDAFKLAIEKIKQDKPDIVLTGFFDVYDTEWVKNTRGEEAAKQIEGERKFPSRFLDKLALFSPFLGKDAINDLYYEYGGIRGRFFKRDFINDNQISFPTDTTYFEDTIFLFRSFLHNPVISIITTPLYNYRNRVDSLSKSKKVIKETAPSFAVMQKTPEYKQASRRVQMLIRDSWLSLIMIGISNLLRHGAPYGTGFDEAYKAYTGFSEYNKEELKSCRNVHRLRKLLFEVPVNPAP